MGQVLDVCCLIESLQRHSREVAVRNFPPSFACEKCQLLSQCYLYLVNQIRDFQPGIFSSKAHVIPTCAHVQEDYVRKKYFIFIAVECTTTLRRVCV